MNKLPKGLSITPFNGYTIARLYNTNIVTIDNNSNTIKLSTNGWTTRHTKKCMNLVLEKFGLHVYQEKGEWYVHQLNGKTYDFSDGMIIAIQ